MAEGWIKLFRKIQEHWIWQDEKKLKWWLSILLNVNHAPQKFPVGDELFMCESGQSFRSIEQWTSMFSCSKKTTIKFFDLLKKDEMISCEIVGNGNRRKHLLTVLNWEEYQSEETELSQPRKPECSVNGNPNVPSNKNEKNDKECKEDIISKYQSDFFDSLIPFVGEFGKETCRDFYDYWTEPNKSKTKIRWQLEKTWDLRKRLTRWSNNNFKKSNGGKQQRSVSEREFELDGIVSGVFTEKGIG